MVGEITSFLSSLLGKLKEAAFPLFFCSGVFLFFRRDIAMFVESDSDRLPVVYLIFAVAIFFLSAATLLQALAKWVLDTIAKAISRKHKRQALLARQIQRFESLNSLNEREAQVLLNCLNSNEQTFCSVYTDAAAMSLASKGLVESKTQGHPLDMPFTISKDVWIHLRSDRDKWIELLASKCEKKPHRNRR
jgi:hypothetical protein